ncbi:anoctamin-1-like isoform X3 [Amphibalanus amphitrite]|uniref:anoctamin-1-like isoform X3 n=1 Tax=Amphibalanus amphitrite TaxID=1232801 RepID=UPI001C8FC695|nr:anoctamin-1-like isoform X3 [Amphibalanus amphitrite]
MMFKYFEQHMNNRTNIVQFYLPDQYFKDGTSKIDFVLVRTCIREDSDDGIDHELRQKIYEENLRKEGLHLEEEKIDENSPLTFVKIHTPWEVLQRYAEILKVRMPMKEPAGLNTDEDFIKKVPVIREITDLVDIVDKGMFGVNPRKFPPKNKYLTGVYSRDREYLFDMSEDFFTPAVRARVVSFILKRKWFVHQTTTQEPKMDFGIDKLLADGTYMASYAPHEGDFRRLGNARALLYYEWANLRKFYRHQPLDYVEDYFGVKIGMYFAWLGFYTYALIPPAIVGIICFLYGVITIYDDVPTNDICADEGTWMCPICDVFCGYWRLNETCVHSRVTYLIDNPSTLFFAIFMSFWAALFLEFWKRYSAEITHRWDLTGFDVKEEHPRPEYLTKLKDLRQEVNVVTKQLEPHVSFWKMRFPRIMISVSVILLLITVAIAIIVGVVLYRLSVLASLAYFKDDYVSSYAMLFTNATAATINLVIVLLLNQVYDRLAEYLTDLELPRTQSEYDDSLTLKIYLLQFINYYASIFYIAFFKGRFHGYPGDYNRIAGFRQEECGPGGCLLELTMQLGIIMVGKQALLTVWEMVLPKLFTWLGDLGKMLTQSKDEERVLPQWAADFKLLDWGPQSLFWEYLEMVIQFGFVTIFVASFPLAPLFAIINNVLEMRLDARKLLVFYRRPVGQRVRDIGIWYRILNTIGKLAVLSNACIIGFTSNFIPRLVYSMRVSEDGTLKGYMNHSLSVFRVADFPEKYRPVVDNDTNIETCRYIDYRLGPDAEDKYAPDVLYWHVLAARLIFVLIFENVVYVVMQLICWITPDVPRKLKERIQQENYLVQEMIVEMELYRSRGEDPSNLGCTLLQRLIGDPEQLKPFAQRSMLMSQPTRRRSQPSDGSSSQQPDRIADIETEVRT